MNNACNAAQEILAELKKVISGKDEVLKRVITAFFAGGNILLEDIPGMGKTTIAVGISKVFGLDFTRIQFTPDTVASDITGFTAFDPASGKFRFHKGAAVTELLLADEINRTSGKTQAALLEVMEERRCTVDGETFPLPETFTVIATQNPTGSAGTSELPLSELDRFMMKLNVGFPDKENLINIMKERHHSDPLESVKKVCSKEKLIEIRKACENVFVSEPVYDYIAELCLSTSECEHLKTGISPRGALHLCRAAKAQAFCEGRDYVVPSDVRENFIAVCSHRTELSASGKISGKTEASVLKTILEQTPSPEKSVKK